jgi:V8-like Glu-specific endopeptidase
MRWAAIIIGLGCVAAAAGTIDDAVPDARYVEYGRNFSTYTAKFRGQAKDGRTHVASAVLVAPRWAITAAHVAAGCTGVTLTYSGDRVCEIQRVIVHPEWKDEGLGRHDIALLEAAGDFGLEFYPPLSTGGEVGKLASVAGYGATGPMSYGHTKVDGVLRAGTQRVDRIERNCLVCDITLRGSSMEYGIAPGDSGGPLFVDGRLAGINSYTASPRSYTRSQYGEESGHTRVAVYREWIERAAGLTPPPPSAE